MTRYMEVGRTFLRKVDRGYEGHVLIRGYPHKTVLKREGEKIVEIIYAEVADGSDDVKAAKEVTA